jgi:very-short-patch-repair endonuclease
MDTDARLARVAERQHGLITRAQAFEAGFTKESVQHRLDEGRWRALRPGAYVIAGSPSSERQSVLAVCLSGGEGVMASHLTAARLWSFDLPAPDQIEVEGRARMAGVRGHRSATMAPQDRSFLGAIALTSPARTLVDCSGRVSPDRLAVVTRDGLRRGLVRLSALRECHERIDTGPGRRATVAMRNVLADPLIERPGDSDGEAILLRRLTDAGLPAPELGYWVRLPRARYRLDVAWPEHKIALELDSWEFHKSFVSFHGDRNRQRRLIAAGWTVLLVTSRTPFDELAADLRDLLHLCGHSRGA